MPSVICCLVLPFVGLPRIMVQMRDEASTIASKKLRRVSPSSAGGGGEGEGARDLAKA